MTRASCQVCKRPSAHCFCHTLIKQDNTSHILIIRHKKEREHPFNTALMAKLQFQNTLLLESDDPNFSNILESFIKANSPFLLFKNSNSKPLKKEITNLDKSLSFIVLDGTWDQATALYLGNLALQNIPIFHLNVATTSLYRPIRKASLEVSLSTLEAIKECLEYLEDKNFKSALAPLEFLVQMQLSKMM